MSGIALTRPLVTVADRRRGHGSLDAQRTALEARPQDGHRSLHLGCGAAAHRGLRPVVRLLPSPDDPWHLPDVRLDGPDDADSELGVLHAAALLEGCRLVVPGTWHTDTVMDLGHVSELIEAADEAVRAEIAAWTRTGAAGEGPGTEGIPAYAFGPRQPLEWPELRSGARDPGSTIDFVHVVFRLGYGPHGRATPRRPVSEVLAFD
ncbi:hypothetical protein [Streptomyces fradiae]|uniref:hypothetical protein n=1 Tax=Streptomyces fradiae TaxID=1906 RepID=UPI00351737D9